MLSILDFLAQTLCHDFNLSLISFIFPYCLALVQIHPPRLLGAFIFTRHWMNCYIYCKSSLFSFWLGWKILIRSIYILQNFPLDFAKRWLPQRRIDVLLMGQTGEWWVTFVGSGRNKGLSRGWRDFATDNKLEEGDTCVITLENMESYTFKVDILRLGKPEKPNRKKKDVERVNAWIRIVKNLTRKSFVNRMKKMT
eukprot:Gb_37797 [translate_table: standard]